MSADIHNNSVAIALKEMATQVRQGTLRLLQVFPEERLTWAPAGTQNHALWHAGHALWLLDVLGIRILTGSSELPDGWDQIFGMHCAPVALQTRWPSRRHVSSLLEDQLVRLLQVFGEFPPSDWFRPTGPNRDTPAGKVVHGLHDEARHQGEMYLLYKLIHRVGS